MTERLPSTEAPDATNAGLDRTTGVERVRRLIEAQRGAVDAALGASAAIARTVDVVAGALRAGSRVVVIGAGTSGRLAVLDASELWPTFGFSPERYTGRIAGGDGALRRSVEGAEDDAQAGRDAVADLGAGDVLIGVSAGGSAPFVLAALAAASERGVRTIAIVNAAESALARRAEIAIEALTGGEPIAGSTRMRAGTAQKIVLNTISTAAMMALGKTYGDRMVDVIASNAKLRARAERLVREFAGDVDAATLLRDADGSVKLAIVMARMHVDPGAGRALLEAAGGRLADVIGDA